MLPGLPQDEEGGHGVLHDAHAARPFDVEGGGDHVSARVLDLPGRGVDVGHAEVGVPAGRALVRHGGVEGGHVLAVLAARIEQDRSVAERALSELHAALEPAEDLAIDQVLRGAR